MLSEGQKFALQEILWVAERATQTMELCDPGPELDRARRAYGLAQAAGLWGLAAGVPPRTARDTESEIEAWSSGF